MAKAMVKCPICNKTFDRNSEEFVQEGRRYAHRSCHEKRNEAVSQEQKDSDALDSYIKGLFKIDYVDARIRQQINKMKKDYGYSYSGILKSLIYFFEIKGNPVEKANGGIGIVPYIYKEAYDYYYRLHVAKEKNKNKKAGEFVGEEIEIIITSPKRKPRVRKLFSMEED